MTAIDDKYAQLGGALGWLGEATNSESACPDGVGRFRHFRSGSIYWHPSSGAWEVHGPIRDKWAQMGWERSELGYPISDQGDAADNAVFSHFTGGSIYSQSEIGSVFVPAPIRATWHSMGWERGSLGLPMSDPVITSGFEQRQRFQGGVLNWSPQMGTSVIPEPRKRTIRLRVFLLDFPDVPAPAEFTRSYVERYLFSLNQLRLNADGRPLQGSANDYFFNLSDGAVNLAGTVDDWLRSPVAYGDIVSSFGRGGAEMAAAVVPLALRAASIGSADDLAVDGRAPDHLLFLHTSAYGGGANRQLFFLKQQLNSVSRSDWWDSRWDAWAGNEVAILPLTAYQPAPPLPQPPTFALPSIPHETVQASFSQTVLLHELGHLLFEYPDMYHRIALWSTWSELMAGFPWTDTPPLLSALTQQLGGWFAFEDLPRRSHPALVLESLETRNTAIRLASGPMGRAENLILEARTIRDLEAPADAPALGSGLHVYRVDDSRSQVVLAEHLDEERRWTFTVRRPGRFGEIWGIDAATALTGHGAHLGNTLNVQGECWWSFPSISPRTDGGVTLDLEYMGWDLIDHYVDADWSSAQSAHLRHDWFEADAGHVMMVNTSQPIKAGFRYKRVLALHPNWGPNGVVRGTYRLAVPGEGGRLHLTVALSEEAAGSDGFTFRVTAEGARVLAETMIDHNRNLRHLVIDLTAYAGRTISVDLEIWAGPTATRDWAYLLEGVLVPTAPIAVDLLAEGRTSVWETNAGPIPFGEDSDAGSVRQRAHQILQDGVLYSGALLGLRPPTGTGTWTAGTLPITLPSAPCVLRAQVGFDERQVEVHGTRISIDFRDAAGRLTRLVPDNGATPQTILLVNSSLTRSVACITADIPSQLLGETGELKVRVDNAEGPAAMTWWPALAICGA